VPGIETREPAYARTMSDLVIITGASSGLGLALARTTPFPATVVDVSRSGPPDDEGIEHIAVDLSRPEQWARVGEEMKRLIDERAPGRIVFIHAAGTLTPIGFAGEVDTGSYAANVILNSAAGQVLGHLFLQAVAGVEASIDLVMISSGAARSVYAGWSSYGAGKAALDQWVRNVGAEQQVRGGVRVSAIAPGVVATAMQREIRSTPERDFPKVERFHDLHDEGELVEPELAARRVWDAIEKGIETGSVIDARAG
jgi:benzil reductase ((S)-benzoin forming)